MKMNKPLMNHDYKQAQLLVDDDNWAVHGIPLQKAQSLVDEEELSHWWITILKKESHLLMKINEPLVNHDIQKHNHCWTDDDDRAVD